MLTFSNYLRNRTEPMNPNGYKVKLPWSHVFSFHLNRNHTRKKLWRFQTANTRRRRRLKYKIKTRWETWENIAPDCFHFLDNRTDRGTKVVIKVINSWISNKIQNFMFTVRCFRNAGDTGVCVGERMEGRVPPRYLFMPGCRCYTMSSCFVLGDLYCYRVFPP